MKILVADFWSYLSLNKSPIRLNINDSQRITQLKNKDVYSVKTEHHGVFHAFLMDLTIETIDDVKEFNLSFNHDSYMKGKFQQIFRKHYELGEDEVDFIVFKIKNDEQLKIAEFLVNQYNLSEKIKSKISKLNKLYVVNDSSYMNTFNELVSLQNQYNSLTFD